MLAAFCSLARNLLAPREARSRESRADSGLRKRTRVVIYQEQREKEIRKTKVYVPFPQVVFNEGSFVAANSFLYHPLELM